MKSLSCLVVLLLFVTCAFGVGCTAFNSQQSDELPTTPGQLEFEPLLPLIVEPTTARNGANATTQRPQEEVSSRRDQSSESSDRMASSESLDGTAIISDLPPLVAETQVDEADSPTDPTSSEPVLQLSEAVHDDPQPEVGHTNRVQAAFRNASWLATNEASSSNPATYLSTSESLSVVDGAGADEIVWPIDARGTIVLARTETISLNFADLDNQLGLVKVGDKFLNPATSKLGNEPIVFTITANQSLKMPLSAGSTRLVVWVEASLAPAIPLGETTPDWEFDVILPSLNDPFAPIITKVSNGKYGDASEFKLSAEHKFFGSRPYIRLEGQYGTQDDLSIVLCGADGTNTKRFAPNDVRIKTLNPSSETWEAEFNLPEALAPEFVSKKAKLYVVRQQGLKHIYSAASLNFNTQIAFDSINFKLNESNMGVSVDSKPRDRNSVSKIFQVNKPNIALTGKDLIPPNIWVVAFMDGGDVPVCATQGTEEAGWNLSITNLEQGRHDFTVALMQGDQLRSLQSTPIPVFVRTEGPRVLSVVPEDFGTAPGITALTVTFNPENPIDKSKPESTPSTGKNVELPGTYLIVESGGTGVFTGGQKQIPPQKATFDAARNAVTLVFDPFPADIYQLRITASNIVDQFGNVLEGEPGKAGTDYVKVLDGKGSGLGREFQPDASPTVRPGISGTTGDFVPFREFVQRPDVPDGFNPNDKVETRVVRLYFYRDAHRIAQIINRKVKSFNRQAVDTYRQLADKARNEANQLTAARQSAERNAIIMANKTRQKENDLQQAENSLNGSIEQLTNYRLEHPDADPDKDPTIQQLESLVEVFTGRVNDMRGQVQTLRDEEVQANEVAQQSEAQEKLGREEQFRREVAAAHTDPDTYAAGSPNSVDPVEQVSVSVVGEGLIQLRGPLKGINVIRIAIDQLDSPVGQVRVAVHTVQINGEKADRMEVVARQIQQYIDQARFLTTQSAEMLRRAVVQVAAAKAEEASALSSGETQEDRDQRYLYSFFGKDFIDELKALDSEFLRSGNKLLSLHSMDTTSLSSALNLMALAKNSTRQMILQEFQRLVQEQLPQAEANYLAAGATCEKKSRWMKRHNEPQTYCLAQNATFESLKGFFNSEIADDETMTPLQREFIRLAQIFKSRLITELEYKQRVMERAIIEQRLGNRQKELSEALEKETNAIDALDELEGKTVDERIRLITVVQEFVAESRGLANAAATEAVDAAKLAQESWTDFTNNLQDFGNQDSKSVRLSNADVTITKLEDPKKFRLTNPTVVTAPIASYKKALEALYNTCSILYEIQGPDVFPDGSRAKSIWVNFVAQWPRLKAIEVEGDTIDAGELEFLINASKYYIKELADTSSPDSPINVLLNGFADSLDREAASVLAALKGDEQSQPGSVFAAWIQLRRKYLDPLLRDPSVDPTAAARFLTKMKLLEDGLREFLGSELRLQFARERALLSRRPLDHKKFLDMLIDDLEEKYIELLDGTRAHVANIDNYLKRVTTALDDDFNTQFYFPAFRFVRQASQYYDVQFGQTETTSILANNREFAKVDPSATMEFDLPKRDILLTEGINGAKAIMNDVGALANDPTFLALASMKSGQPVSSPTAGATGGFGVVRDVLPGLDSTTSEQVMSQNANGGQQFGSNLENLIPDPAVYKFETGTGYEIRPVIQPDGQAVVFDFNYMYTTQIREPVRADEKHLGRVKRHFIDTDVQLSNFELREVSRYTVALKAARTSRGVPLLEDLPVAGALFRPLPSDESSLQQNLIMAQATIFPTLFDLMGLRWAPVVADLDPLRLSDDEFIVRNRHRMLENRVYDESSTYVDKFLRIPESERRMDLYRSQETVPYIHPNGYQGPGMNLRDSELQEGYQPTRMYPEQQFAPSQNVEGAQYGTKGRPARRMLEELPAPAPQREPPPPGLQRRQ